MIHIDTKISICFFSFLFSLAVIPFSASASDAVYDWVKTAGGTGDDGGGSPIVDSSGNVYFYGIFQSTVDFDPSAGVDNHTSNGGYDIFLSKYDVSGNYQWTKTFGGASTEVAYGSALSLDEDDNIYISGTFQSTVDFDPGTGTDIRTSIGSEDIFLAKYDSHGNYQWVKTFGGTGAERAYGFASGGANGMYISGRFQNTVDFNPGADTDNKTSAGSNDMFLAKYDASGNYQWVKTIGGTGGEGSTALAVDLSGNVFVYGYFISSTVDFDPGTGTDNHSRVGSTMDWFLSKYDSSGSYQWTKTFTAYTQTSFYQPEMMKVDSHGSVYIANSFVGTMDFDPSVGTDNRTSAGGWDAFLAKYDSNGNYEWVRTWGGAGNDSPFSLEIDQDDNVYSSGRFENIVDFDSGSGTDERVSAGGSDAFLVKYDASGNYQWTKTIGSTGRDYFYSVLIDNDTMYVSGGFGSTVDFDPSSGVDNRTSVGSLDTFLAKFTIDSLSPSLSLSGSTLINTSSHTYTATLSDTLSPILSLEYQVDSTSDSWTSCTPDDKTFDEKEENASCSLSNLTEGSHTIYFRTSDTSQNISDSFPVSLTVDLTAPSSSLKQTLSFKSKNNPITKTSLNKESKNYVSDQKPKIQGTNKSAKNGTVSFYRKDGRTKKTLLGTASIDGKGKWSFTLPKKKEQGTLDYRLVFTDEAGNVSESSSSFQITRDWKKPDFLTSLPDTI